jgi:hypothetical protein
MKASKSKVKMPREAKAAATQMIKRIKDYISQTGHQPKYTPGSA